MWSKARFCGVLEGRAFAEETVMKHWIAGVVALVGVYALTPVAQAGRADSGTPTQLQAKEEAPKGQKAKKKLSDAQIRQILIDESIAAYSGNCPCPYNRASNGSRCGRRSAYSREGGESPLCYAKDVTAEMVQEFRVQREDKEN
jgi:hypothetical protein